MKFPLKIETHDTRLGFDIAAFDTIVDAPGGAKVEYRCMHVCKSIDIPRILEFIVDASEAIDVGLFTAWLYSKVKDKPVVKITIRSSEITEITEGNIRKVLEEEITINE